MAGIQQNGDGVLRYTVETIDNAWSYIVGPDGYREGPIRYRSDAEQWAAEMNEGKPPPKYITDGRIR